VNYTPGPLPTRIGFSIVAAMLLLDASEANAGCSRTVNLGTTSVSFPAAISIPPNAPVGTVVATVTAPVSGAAADLKYASCSGSDTLYWAIQAVPVVANRVGTTSVAGIGYTSFLSGGGFGNDITMDSGWSNSATPGGPTSPSFQSQLSVTVKLVVTGPVASGALSLNPGGGAGLPNQVAAYFVNNSGTTLFNVVVPANSTTITSSACSVTTPSIAVTLPPVSSSAFQRVGSTAGARNMSIDLNCPSSPVRIFITLTDSTTPTNTSSNLSLKPNSTAKGVGLQILNAGNPVNFGPDSSNAGNTNQWFVSTSNGGMVQIPLVVQYIQTGTPVAPGSVNGTATFTMSYQ
jgi:type 1 fimbria pilin